MSIPYEILIRGNGKGGFQGAHAIDTPGGEARAVTAEDLAAIAPEINAAALARADEIEVAHAEALSLKSAEYLEALGLKDTEVSEAIAAKEEELRVAKLPEEERRKEEIREQILKLQAQLE